MFNYLPTPTLLQGLAKGRLSDRLQRSVRLWALLHQLYGPIDWASQLPQPFRYRDICDRIFADTHGRSETAGVAALTAHCDQTCCCQKTMKTWLEDSSPTVSLNDWMQAVIALTDLSEETLTAALEDRPFATVHRSIRTDLAYLADLGWLVQAGQGRFRCVTADHWPPLPSQPPPTLGHLTLSQTWEVLRSLENLAFVQPELNVIVNALQENLIHQQPNAIAAPPTQRIFIHLDYILSEEMQDHVDTLQAQLEQLWQRGNGIIQFQYHSKSNPTHKTITVYPVCLHYVRRAKYLSAYGVDPQGTLGWHNYRLDRIISKRLTLFAWGDPQVPEALRKRQHQGNLPTTTDVSNALEAAWGFNFYHPRQLLIMRFSPDFAARYVAQTYRHPTFRPVAYEALPEVTGQKIKDPDSRANVLEILAHRSPQDIYYQAWIRQNDINIVMRLRDWRPQGEVIAPLDLRKQMQQEAEAELIHYQQTQSR